jgi:pimeloyl-ACP methyl ester carboxylesterase
VEKARQVFMHGLGQTSSSWDDVLSQLETVDNPICPNISELMKVDGNGVEYNSIYSSFSTKLNEESSPLSICGLSLGGVLALNFAVDYPEKVESLILIAAQYKMPKNLLKLQNIVFRFMPNSTFEKIGLKKVDFISLCNSMMAIDFSDSIHKITCPTLIVCGEKDKANLKSSMALASAIPNAELQMLEGVGHEVNIEAPEKLAEIISAFYLRIN